MKERKLRKGILPAAYLLVITILFGSVFYLNNILTENVSYGNMSVSAITDTNATPVVSVDDTVKEVTIVKPFSSEKVGISKSFYDMRDEAKKQEDSLVYYEKTYLQNSGVLYSSDEEFEVSASMDGTVTNVGKDEILGEYVEITHNTNLKTLYYSLKDITVKKNDTVAFGQVIAKSGDNLLDKEKENCLLFEVYHNGFLIDPEDFYNMTIDDLS